MPEHSTENMHIGRRYYAAVCDGDFTQAADYLALMVRRYMAEFPLNGDDALQVFLSSHLISAFDLSGTLQIRDMKPFETIIHEEISHFRNTGKPQAEISEMTHSIMERIRQNCIDLSPDITERMLEIQSYVDRNYSDPNLNVNSLSSFFGISLSYLSHSFRQVTGGRLNDYIHFVRMRAAKNLLKDTNLLVREIAVRIGFPAVGTFIRAFRKSEGISPGAYRESLRSLSSYSDTDYLRPGSPQNSL